MIRSPTIGEVVELHRRLIETSGGSHGIRDLGRLEAAVVQPRMTYGGLELYPTLIEKAAALCFSLVQNHPFLDGNKRVGHAAMEVLLLLNGFEIDANVDDQEAMMLALAGGHSTRDDLIAWLRDHVVAVSGSG